MTLDEIVSGYIRDHRRNARAEMCVFERQHSSAEATRMAALCIVGSGKRHRHQRRIPKAVLERAEARLQEIARRLASAADFAALHELVEEHIGGLRGIGALTVYDIAHRLGAYFRKAPELVYLHAGTRIGARAFNISGGTLDPKNLPAAFSRLEPAEIEDCLCIYRDNLQAAKPARRSRGISCVDVAPRQRATKRGRCSD
jgi:hypothetical protein